MRWKFTSTPHIHVLHILSHPLSSDEQIEIIRCLCWISLETEERCKIKKEEFEFSGSAPLLVTSIRTNFSRTIPLRRIKKGKEGEEEEEENEEKEKEEEEESFGHFLADQTAKPICKRLDEERASNFINSQLTSNK